ncbi:MAG: NAD-dependent epimerase/dehydratase family protein [Bdellovibrionales bacterium]|nr:NAD-dependent epimerase/dehydratase family protein [Bdellovibrionales bacterium]
MKSYRSQVRAQDFHPETRAFFKGKRVAITGGTGFIGSHLVEQLLEMESFPVILTRQSSPRFLAHIIDQIELRPCDLFDYASTLEAMKDCSICLSLAASVAGIEYNKNHPATIFQENLQSFFNTIKAAKESEVERFLVTSTACVYPRYCSIPTPEIEGIKDEPEPTNSGYGWSKRMEEYLGQKYAQEFGMSVAIARPYNSYGPRDNFQPESSHVIPALILKAMTCEGGSLPVWGDGSHSRSFLYVDDFARGLLEVAARYPVADPVNIGSQEEIKIRDLAYMVAEIVGKLRACKIEPQFDPSGITGQPRRMCDTTKLEKELGFKAQVPFKEGLKTTIDWFWEEYEKNSSLYPRSK